MMCVCVCYPIFHVELLQLILKNRIIETWCFGARKVDGTMLLSWGLAGLPKYQIQDFLIWSDQDEDVPYSLIEKLQESGINAADLKKLKDWKASSNNTCNGEICGECRGWHLSWDKVELMCLIFWFVSIQWQLIIAVIRSQCANDWQDLSG